MGDIREKIVIEKVGIMCENGKVVIGELCLFDILFVLVNEWNVDVVWV